MWLHDIMARLKSIQFWSPLLSPNGLPAQCKCGDYAWSTYRYYCNSTCSCIVFTGYPVAACLQVVFQSCFPLLPPILASIPLMVPLCLSWVTFCFQLHVQCTFKTQASNDIYYIVDHTHHFRNPHQCHPPCPPHHHRHHNFI